MKMEKEFQLRRLIKEELKRQISEAYNKESSAKDFLQFIKTVKDEGLFDGAQWGLSDGHATQYLPLEQFIPALVKQIKEKGDEIESYYIWSIDTPKGIKYMDVIKTIEGGLNDILELGRENKDGKFGKIGTSFESAKTREFAKAMSGGEFGSLDENLMSQLGDELADLIKKEVEEEDKELKEIVDPVSILSYVLASTTLVNIIAKYVGKLFKKYNIEKGAKGAKTIYDFTHKLENDFKSPIKRIVKLFTKDEKTIDIVTNSLYALLILSLGVSAGGGAVQDLSKGNIASGTISSLKAALKGKDLTTLVKDIAKAAV